MEKSLLVEIKTDKSNNDKKLINIHNILQNHLRPKE